MEAAEAMARAASIAGLDDFGPYGFEWGLVRSLDAFERLPLTPEALAAARERLVRDLVTRLRIEQWYKDNPGVEDLEIEGPVFVIGMPSSGISAIAATLALDERFRFLRGWEGASPVPPPILGHEDADRRAISARADHAFPDRLRFFHFDPDGPQEDMVFLGGLDMHGFHGSFPMPADYVLWWIAEDFGTTYAYHARVLRMLQSRRPPYLWLLKSPLHLFKLPAILRQYPRARFIMAHRDPCLSVPAAVRAHHALCERRCGPASVDKAVLGRHLLEFWRVGMERAMAAREVIGEDRFLDVHSADILAEPGRVMERIHAHIGLAPGQAMAEGLRDEARRRLPAEPRHGNALDEFGLCDIAVNDAFGAYRARFEV